MLSHKAPDFAGVVEREGQEKLVVVCLRALQRLISGRERSRPLEELVDDTWNRQVVARGNVEIRYYGEILVADEIAYDRDSRKLMARGNVSLTEADGKVTQADRLILNDELRDAFIAYVRRQRIRIDL